MPSNHLILCHLLLLLPSIFPSIRVFSSESILPSDGQSIGASASASVLPMTIKGWFPLGLNCLISLQSKGLSRVWRRSLAPQFESISSSVLSLLYGPTLTSIHDNGKTIALTRRSFVSKMMSLLLNMLSRFVIAFLLWSKCLNFMTAVTMCCDFGAQENKICYCFHFFPFYLS